MSSARISRQIGLVCITLSLLTGAASRAAELQIASFPTVKVNGLGFTMDVHTTPSATVGNRPVTARINPVAPRFPAERILTIELRPRPQLNTPHVHNFRQTITIPEGARTHQAVLQVPVYYQWYRCRVRVYEDGAILPGCDTADATATFPVVDHHRTLGVIQARTQDNDPPLWQVFPNLRVIQMIHRSPGSGLPQLGYSHSNWQQYATEVESGKLDAESLLRTRVINEDRLPRKWTRYANLDAILIAAGTLERIAREDDLGFRAIRQWVGCGGALWTYGIGQPSELDDLFPTRDTFGAIDQELVDKQWSARSRTLVTSRPNGGFRQPIPFGSISNRLQSLTGSPAIGDVVAVKDYLAGRIVHIKHDYPFPGEPALWSLVEALTANQIGTENRLGTNIVEGDDNFWDWLIGEVGQPPVYTFLFMISLFVLLVGPVSYYFFMYMKRLYMFFVFAPVVALGCTLCIGLYALVADGFGTRVRVRHLTLLDNQGHSISWSRQTYFAGLRPRDGVAWPNDQLVFPLSQSLKSVGPLPDDSQGEGDDTMAVITAERDVNRFEGSFLPSRRQSQFFVIGPNEKPAILRARQTDDVVRITNQSPYGMQELLFADANSRYWFATDVPAGAQAIAEEIGPVEAIQWAGNLYLGSAPQKPLGYQNAGDSELLKIGNRNRGIRGRDVRDFQTINTNGLVESMFQYVLSESGKLEPSTFAALADVLPESIGVEGAMSVESIHLVNGPIQIDGQIHSDRVFESYGQDDDSDAVYGGELSP